MTRIGDNQPSKLQTTSNNGDVYAGGRIEVEIYAEDGQRDVTYRGMYNHAEKAGLPHEDRVKFAERWATDTLFHHENGKTRPYSSKEFAALKKKGVTPFDLDEKYSPNILNDLRERQAAYRLSQQNIQQQQMANIPSVSAPQSTDAEKAVNWITEGVQSITGSESEVGKQFNRLSVSSLRLMGSLKELENKATEKLNDAIRYAAPDSVDQILNKVDEANRQQAQALKNANTTVTNDDRYEDLRSEKEGIKRPIAEDLHRKVMYFPEAIPNAIDSAIKGDLKDDDGSYSDKVGKIVGGLNPVGDIRDVIANIKNVSEGKPGSKVALGASIIGAAPVGGDAAKIFIKGNKEVIEETVEGVVKTEAKAADDTFVGTLRGQVVELKNVEIRQIQYTKRTDEARQELRKEFNQTTRSDFLKRIAGDSATASRLKEAGLSDAHIEGMRIGRVPEKWQVHHKLPLDDGGDNTFTNLILIKNDPYHQTITNEQNSLTRGLRVGDTRELKWVVPPGFVYPSKN